MNLEALVRPNIVSLRPFRSARSEFAGHADIYLDANEHPEPSRYNRYPDPFHKKLRAKIAQWRNIEVDQIILGNGSDEIIDMIIRTFCVPGKDIVRVIEPTFGMYEVSSRIHDVAVESIPLNLDFQLDVDACLRDQTEHNKLLFMCSPNNPTGNDLNPSDLLTVIEGWQGIVVVDEAYIDFSQQDSLLKEIERLNHLIVLQTFSKSLGGAGLRVGICYADVVVVKYLNKVKPPYNIGSLTQEIAEELITALMESGDLASIISERERMRRFLSGIEEVIKIYPSESNFLLVRFEDHLELKDFLEDHGIIVRDRSTLPGCEQCLRITVGMHDENAQLIANINEFYALNKK